MSSVLHTTEPRIGGRGRFRARAVLAALGAAVLLPGLAAAQSAAEIFESALQKYEERARGVDNYVLVQEVMGVRTSTYFEKQEIEGYPVFVPVEEGAAMQLEGLENPYVAFPELARRASVEGTETIDGRATWVLAVDDFSGLDFTPAAAREQGEFEPTRGKFWLDREDYVLRKMWMEGAMRRNGQASPVSVEARFSDYRTVEGMMHPFHVALRADGLADAAISPEERAQAEEGLRELRAQMEQMPEGQRRMMEDMMKGQLEQLEQLVKGEAVEFTATVKELRVNVDEGPAAANGEGGRP